MENFSAIASALGYLYQARHALYLLCSEPEAEAEMSIEFLDDISISREGKPVEILQAGHHINSTANLSDASTDLWETLRRWSVAIVEGSVNPGRTSLTLITNGRAPNDSAASMLKPHSIPGRDASRALQILREIAVASESQINRPAYDAFVNLSAFQQRALIRSLHILDSTTGILDTRDQILKLLRISVRPQFLEAVNDRVESWWFDRLILQLSSEKSPPILYRELWAQINDMQRHLDADSLPDIQLATSDYYRSFQQRSKWVREELVPVGEREQYEKRSGAELTKNITPWEKRSTERASLLNPAFCGELIRRCVKAHNSFADHQLPFPLIFLTLPIILHRRTRESISANTREQMHVWLQNHQDARIGFAERARDLVPVTREAIAFLFQRGAIAVDNRAGLRLTRYVSRTVPVNEEITDCYRKAEILGRWLARAGSTAAIYTMWGVRP